MPIKHIKLKLRTRGRGENVILCVYFISSFPLYFLFFSLFLSHFLSHLISLSQVLFQNMMKLYFSTYLFLSQLALSHIFTSPFFLHVWSRLASSILYPVANMPLLLFLFVSSWFVSFIVSCFILSQLVSFLIVSCLSFFFSWLILIHFNTFSRLVLSVLWSHFNCLFYLSSFGLS